MLAIGLRRVTSAPSPVTPLRESPLCATMPESSNFAEANATRMYALNHSLLEHNQSYHSTAMLTSTKFKMKRNPRKLKWTKAFRKSAGKEMIVDTTLTFAARRNIPVRYNRDLVATTLKAMQRVSDIRTKRERVFYKNRMAGNKERERAANRKLVAENEHLLPRIRGSEKMAIEAEEEEPMVQEETVKVPAIKQKKMMKGKQRLLVSGGVEEMDVD